MAQDCWPLFGLDVHSELELPFPKRPRCTARDEVHVRLAKVPSQGRFITRLESDVLQLEIQGVGRFQVIQGTTIAVDPLPGVSDRKLSVYVLGSAFGALLHQRGLLPLHANVVVVAGQAVAFMGVSGAGKSTLAAWFQDQGYAVLADDVCALTFGTHGQPTVLPGVPRLRLWRDAVLRSGRNSDELERSFEGEDKFDLPALRHDALSEVPLAGCYVLHASDQPAQMLIGRLAGVEAVEALIANTYRGNFVKVGGWSERHFRCCVHLSRFIPVHRVERQKNSATFHSGARQVEEHVLASYGSAKPLSD